MKFTVKPGSSKGHVSTHKHSGSASGWPTLARGELQVVHRIVCNVLTCPYMRYTLTSRREGENYLRTILSALSFCRKTQFKHRQLTLEKWDKRKNNWVTLGPPCAGVSCMYVSQRQQTSEVDRALLSHSSPQERRNQQIKSANMTTHP